MIDRIRFPSICPVCGKPADEITTVTLAERTYLESSAFRGMLVTTTGGAGRYRYQNYSPSGGQRKTIRVPTCELHKHEGIRGEFKTCWFVFALVSIAPILMLFYGLVNTIIYGGVIELNLLALVLMVGALFVSTYYVYWPRPFQRAFKIIDFTPNDMDILVRIKNQRYLEEFISMNEMYVSIIDDDDLQRIMKQR